MRKFNERIFRIKKKTNIKTKDFIFEILLSRTESKKEREESPFNPNGKNKV